MATFQDIEQALRYVEKCSFPLAIDFVIPNSGKGRLFARTMEDARKAISDTSASKNFTIVIGVHPLG